MPLVSSSRIELYLLTQFRVFDFLTEEITVRELIRSRVHQEVKHFNAKKAQVIFNGLVRPTDTEETLNGYALKKHRLIDWEKQLEKAVKAFEQNQILILIDEKQVESLEQNLRIRTDTKVTFIKLTPLVGG